jgi:hypothetical protein
MTWTTMVWHIEQLLEHTGLEYDRRGLMEYVDAMSPHINCDPTPERWAREFVEAVKEQAVAAAN